MRLEFDGFFLVLLFAHSRNAKSRGHLAIRSTDPFEQPRIAPNYFAEEIDRKTIVAGLKILREIYRQKSLNRVGDISV